MFIQPIGHACLQSEFFSQVLLQFCELFSLHLTPTMDVEEFEQAVRNRSKKKAVIILLIFFVIILIKFHLMCVLDPRLADQKRSEA
ncbi:hypothetical protein K8R62_01650 [bacterium]|nr:hypothetical protein [bacterium]